MTAQDEAPPRIAELLLVRCVSDGVVGRSIVGDAREEYAERLLGRSRALAALWYWTHVLSLVAHFSGGRSGGDPSGRKSGGEGNGTLSTKLESLLTDLRIAFRSLVAKPGFTLAAVVTLALGIGANTTMFSLVYGVLIKPLPYPNSDQLVGVFREDPDVTGSNPSPSRLSGLFAVPYEVFLDWKEMSSSYQEMGAYFTRSFTLTGGDRPERISGAMATSGVFSALGIRPAVGRVFIPADDAVGAPGVAVVSDGLWQRRFGGDPSIIGQHLMLSGISYEVVGVMPSDFGFPYDGTEVWMSFADERKTSPVRSGGYLQVLARLEEHVSLEQARADGDGVALRIGEMHPEESEHGLVVFPRKTLEVADLRAGLVMLLGAVGLVLLIACANIANLLLVRAAERRRELGVRMALGASRARLLSQYLSEGVVLSLAGGAAGFFVAIASLGPFKAAFPGGLPRADSITTDHRMLMFALSLSVMTGLLTGALPAFRAIRTPVVSVLQDGGRGAAGGRRRNRTQAALVVVEIALAFVLLVGAGLFVRSLARLTGVESGFDTEDLLTMGISLPAGYQQSDDASVQFFEEFNQRLRGVPGVESVGSSNQMPFVGGWSTPPILVETSDGFVETNAHETMITPEYLSTMGIPVVAGRGLESGDRQGALPVAVVNEAMVNRYWPGENPLGRRIGFATQTGDSAWVTVVGVIGDVRYRLNIEPFPSYHLPIAQWPSWYQWVVVRTAIDESAITPAVQEALLALDPDVPTRVLRIDDQIADSFAIAGPRFGVFILSCLSGLAALLAVVGIYGVIAYTVHQRANEIGIRLALGAGTGKVLGSVLLRGFLLSGIGLLCGLGLALGLSRMMEGMLFDVSPADPLTLVSVSILVAVATAVASLVPARRATAVNPADVLRQE